MPYVSDQPLSLSEAVSFDEAEYLRRYPDVVEAIERGKYRSGREHYERYGRAEGRVFTALPSELAEVAVGVATGFEPSAPAAPRHAIDAVLIAEDGWVCVVGWVDDSAEPLCSLRIEGRGWSATAAGRALPRLVRADVQKALEVDEARSFGFLLLIRTGARISPPRECRVAFQWQGQEMVLLAPARTVSPQEMLTHVLTLLTRAGGNRLDTMLALKGGLGSEIARLSRAVSGALVRAPFVERFGDQKRQPKTSIIVCLYGRPEYLFLQNALFANRPGIEECEFIYVCNSPELIERLLKDAACGTTIYGLSQTVVGLSGNAGFGPASNLGAGLARAGRILCLNPDVFPREPGWAARHNAIAEAGGAGSRLFGTTLFYDDGALMHGGMYFALDPVVAVRPGFVQSDMFARVEHYGKGAPPDTKSFLRPRPVPAVSGAFLSAERAWFERLGGSPRTMCSAITRTPISVCAAWRPVCRCGCRICRCGTWKGRARRQARSAPPRIW